MGGKPLTALNLVMFPSKILDKGILRDLLRGGNDKVLEAGASMAGGHSVDDEEPKYGLAVTGVVHPDKVLKNCSAQPGDVLILTKPIGSGVLFNACRSKKLPFSELERLLPQIAALNRKALEVAINYDLHACTDITGFGIIGHALEMAVGSGVQIDISWKQLPIYPHAIEMYEKGETTGSNAPNKLYSSERFTVKAELSTSRQELLFDPQTSGGLLFSVPCGQADALVAALKAAKVDAASKIGEVLSTQNPCIRVI